MRTQHRRPPASGLRAGPARGWSQPTTATPGPQASYTRTGDTGVSCGTDPGEAPTAVAKGRLHGQGETFRALQGRGVHQR
ncbi:hypothetical protein [Streptomyces sp. NBC_00038]|uniref:hypothetical protein n=1 Tax=Streptomyces sp. NBC_00038 TaxID=2903615 RepID=UPI0022502BE0|nr:hypothetical protein [Streptomyces sp. NBC_00038]MCX5561568.1 hypothetical protein [Streptomyces sp. NBC_00038]